jgi:ATP-dependent Zn protease
VTSGATSDLQQATNLARYMVKNCGMSELVGPIYLSETSSPDTEHKVELEVTRLLREAYERVTQLLVRFSPCGSASCKRMTAVLASLVLLVPLTQVDNKVPPNGASTLRQQAKEAELHKLASALLAHETLNAKEINDAISTVVRTTSR